MGNQESTMKVQGLILVAFGLFPAFESQTSAPPCCQKKTVTSSDGQGVYTLKRSATSPEHVDCVDGCIYTKDGGSDEYCFQQVSSGAATIDDECEASSPAPGGSSSAGPGGSSSAAPGGSSPPPEGSSSAAPGGSSQPGSSGPTEGSTAPGSSPPGSSGPTGGSTAPGSSGPTSGGPTSTGGPTSSGGPTSTGGPTSSQSPQQIAEDANTKITELGTKIGEEQSKQNTATSASDKVDEINNALTSSTTPAGRFKRQAASTTPAAGSCAEFNNNFVQLLSLLKDLSDDMIDDITSLVSFFATSLPNVDTICTAAEKTQIKTENAAASTEAKNKVVTYKEEKDQVINGYRDEIKVQEDKLEVANQQLASLGQPTIAAATIPYTFAPETSSAAPGGSSAAPGGSSAAPDGSSAPPQGSSSAAPGGSSPPPEGSSSAAPGGS